MRNIQRIANEPISGFQQVFNDEKNAEAYFRETKAFQETFDCNIIADQTMSEKERKDYVSRYNEFY